MATALASSIDLAVAAEQLADSGDYRVLRRFQPRQNYAGVVAPFGETSARLMGAYVDCETTGLDTARDNIVELALLLFEFDARGTIYDVGEGCAWLNDPGVPIPPETTAVHGITDADVAGHSIDDGAVHGLMQDVVLVVAHNASFDRRMIERRLPVFVRVPWACSLREVPWRRFGAPCGTLEHIIQATCGEFYEPHRALDDCRAGVHVLASAQLEERTALSYLLESARQPTVRVLAFETPYDDRAQLKARRYHWRSEDSGKRKAWFRDVAPADVDAELAWLQATVYAHRLAAPPIALERWTCWDRYSVRVDTD